VPVEHPLRELFREVTHRAFDDFRGLYDPGVEVHIADAILSEFVHVDRLYKVRDSSGAVLSELADVVSEARSSGSSSGVERDLEIHQHTGDYALFVAGLYPESIERRRPVDAKPLLVFVGSSMVRLDRPRDYYIVEGRSAYSHVSRIYERLDPPRSGVFHRLSSRFEEYLEVMGCIRDHLRRSPEPGGEAGLIR
jgi:hypothetical protein